MFLIDDILAAPARGLIFVLKKINEAVQEEIDANERAVMSDLSALHRALDSGSITEAEFDAREADLLNRLDRLHRKDGDDARDDARS